MELLRREDLGSYLNEASLLGDGETSRMGRNGVIVSCFCPGTAKPTTEEFVPFAEMMAAKS